MRKSYFTLIEMLVVIAIIIILAGMVLAGIQVVRKKQAVVLTVTYMKQLEVAIGQYQQIYSYLPFTLEHGTATDYLVNDDDDNGDLTTGTNNYEKLMLCLSADDKDTATIALNPRRQKFIELDENGKYQDAWGNDFRVTLDLTYDDKIDDHFVWGEGNLKRNIAIWSAGRDGLDNQANGDATNADNQGSWTKRN
jgi:type II secretory pathway pseudopilin PulG